MRRFAILLLLPLLVASEFKIVIAEVDFAVVDLNAKDVFVFTGPVVKSAGTIIGINERGQEVRVIVQAAPVTPPPKLVPSNTKPGWLNKACATCHTRGVKTSGGVALFDATGKLAPNVESKDILAEIEAGRMPPGKPKPSAANLEEAKAQLLR